MRNAKIKNIVTKCPFSFKGQFASYLTYFTKEWTKPIAVQIIPSMVIVKEHLNASLVFTVWFTRDPALILPGSPITPVPTIPVPVSSNPSSLSQTLSQTF